MRSVGKERMMRRRGREGRRGGRDCENKLFSTDTAYHFKEKNK